MHLKNSTSNKKTMIGNVSSTETELFPHGHSPQNDAANPYIQIRTNYSSHRHFLAPRCCPHYHQASLALLHAAGGKAGSFGHSPFSCNSSVHLNQTLNSCLPPLCLVHSVQPTSITPIHQTQLPQGT